MNVTASAQQRGRGSSEPRPQFLPLQRESLPLLRRRIVQWPLQCRVAADRLCILHLPVESASLCRSQTPRLLATCRLMMWRNTYFLIDDHSCRTLGRVSGAFLGLERPEYGLPFSMCGIRPRPRLRPRWTRCASRSLALSFGHTTVARLVASLLTLWLPSAVSIFRSLLPHRDAAQLQRQQVQRTLPSSFLLARLALTRQPHLIPRYAHLTSPPPSRQHRLTTLPSMYPAYPSPQ